LRERALRAVEHHRNERLEEFDSLKSDSLEFVALAEVRNANC